MQKLRTLLLAAALTVSFASTMYADGGGLPCPPPEPGQTNTPPCTMAQLAEDGSVGQNGTIYSPAANDVSEYSVTELALDVIENLLTLF